MNVDPLNFMRTWRQIQVPIDFVYCLRKDDLIRARVHSVHLLRGPPDHLLFTYCKKPIHLFSRITRALSASSKSPVNSSCQLPYMESHYSAQPLTSYLDTLEYVRDFGIKLMNLVHLVNLVKSVIMQTLAT